MESPSLDTKKFLCFFHLFVEGFWEVSRDMSDMGDIQDTDILRAWINKAVEDSQ